MHYIGEQQLIEDLYETLSCEDSETLQCKITLISKMGSDLLREGFRTILREDHNNEIVNLI